MSEVLDEFREPFSDLADTENAYRKLLNLGMLAWNAALLSEDLRRAVIDETLEAGFSGASAADRAQAREFVEMLVLRKQKHFAGNHGRSSPSH